MNDYEVGAATHTDVVVYAPGEVAERVDENGEMPGQHALVIGDPDSRAYAVVGTLPEIQEWLSRAYAALAVAVMPPPRVAAECQEPELVVVANPPPLVVANRTTAAAARAHFEAGGKVIVGERGHELVYVVGPTTTTHDKTTCTWEWLEQTVAEWRNRYPNQRYYIVPMAGAGQ